MRKFSLLLALCLMLSIFSGCGSKPAETTSPDLPKPTLPDLTAPEDTTPATEPPVGDGKFTIDLPDGFTGGEVETNRYSFLSPNAPEDHSAVTVELMAHDESVLDMTTSQYKNRIDVTKTGTSDAKRFKLIDLWQEQVDGWPAVVSEYNLVYEDYISHIFRYEIVCESMNYVFTFDDASDNNDWLDHFETMIGSVKLIQTEGGIELNFTEMSQYALGCGLKLFAEAGLSEMEAYSFTACLGSRSCIILFMADNKEVNHLTDFDLEEYARLVQRNNDLRAFRRDEYNNLYTTFYTTDEDGTGYFNMLFVKETADAFWVCQMACVSELQGTYERDFPLWASSITE